VAQGSQTRPRAYAIAVFAHSAPSTVSFRRSPELVPDALFRHTNVFYAPWHRNATKIMKIITKDIDCYIILNLVTKRQPRGDCRLPIGEGGVGEIRSSQAEIRKKSEIRNPNAESATPPVRMLAK
jgi:hypothetical protein